MKFIAFMLATLVAFGCQPQLARVQGRPSDDWCRSHFCVLPEEMVFTAAGEGLHDMLRADLARWAAATGREIATDAQLGIPVLWRDGITGPDGEEDCAQTIVKGFTGQGMWTQVIYLDPTPPAGCPAPEVSLLHELEHALAPTAEHVEVDSLFAKSTGSQPRSIDAAALSRLCETFDCLEFRPEE